MMLSLELDVVILSLELNHGIVCWILQLGDDGMEHKHDEEPLEIWEDLVIVTVEE